MIKKIINWIKSHKVEFIISLIAIGIVFFLVIKGVNFLTALIGTITGGLAIDVGMKKVIKQNKKLDKEKKEKLNKLKEKRTKENEKIDNLSGNDLANDVNKKYRKYRKQDK